MSEYLRYMNCVNCGEKYPDIFKSEQLHLEDMWCDNDITICIYCCTCCESD